MEYVNETVLDSNLTSVANAIRGKTGGSSQLAFPTGFVTALNGLIAKNEHISPLLEGVNDTVVRTSSLEQSYLITAYNSHRVICYGISYTVAELKTRCEVSKVYKIDATTKAIVELTDDSYVPAEDDYLMAFGNSGTAPTALYLVNMQGSTSSSPNKDDIYYALLLMLGGSV